MQFCHPAKILGGTRLPGTLSDRALARLYGIEEDGYRALVDQFAARAEEQAQRLLDDDELRAAARAFPAYSGDRVLAFGDSLTDDLQSWAEILGRVLCSVRQGVRVVNAGLSGDTTTGARTRVHRLVAERPDRVLILLGTNDARRHGGCDASMLVSHDETARNLRCLSEAIAAVCPWTRWIAPPPVDEQRIERDPLLRAAGLSWRSDDVEAKAALVRAMPGPTVDTRVAVADAPDEDLLLADGLHPSLAGQARIAAEIIRTLAAS